MVWPNSIFDWNIFVFGRLAESNYFCVILLHLLANRRIYVNLKVIFVKLKAPAYFFLLKTTKKKICETYYYLRSNILQIHIHIVTNKKRGVKMERKMRKKSEKMCHGFSYRRACSEQISYSSFWCFSLFYFGCLRLFARFSFFFLLFQSLLYTAFNFTVLLLQASIFYFSN